MTTRPCRDRPIPAGRPYFGVVTIDEAGEGREGSHTRTEEEPGLADT